MRNNRPIFEGYVHPRDIQQRRVTRTTTNAARKAVANGADSYEEYITVMARNATYGGEPELVAFCQVYDQDVTVHLPRIKNFDRDAIVYQNELRPAGAPAPASLHICYGGDEESAGHYDSTKLKEDVKESAQEIDKPLVDRRRAPTAPRTVPATAPATPASHARAQRPNQPTLSVEMLQSFLQKGKKDGEGGYERLGIKSRGRSDSMSSSHRSSSSKRSLEDDSEPVRATKKADRRKSMKKRADAQVPAPEMAVGLSFRLHLDSPRAETPVSTQSTEYSSDPGDRDGAGSPQPGKVSADDEETDESGIQIKTADPIRKVRKGAATASKVVQPAK